MSEVTGDGRKGLIDPAYRIGFVLIVSLFFLWAIANNFNDLLIRQFQKSLGLNRAEAGLIQFVFYIGYFVVALPAGLLMRRFGYRAGILTGLGLYAAGALLFFPASIAISYPMFLFALFVIASGAAFLETTANAYAGYFGDKDTAVQRLNLAQSFNGLGASVAPAIGGLLIFSGVEHSADTLGAMSPAELAAYRASEATTVQLPYLILAAAAIAIAIAVAVTRMPAVREAEGEPLGAQVRMAAASPALRGAVFAQFLYVGAQVGIWSYFIDFVKDELPHVSEREAAFLLSASLVMFMVGRFTGTAAMSRIAPARLLALYAAINVALCLVAVLGGGWLAVCALMLVSFFMSIMFPTIFALGVDGLGSARPLGSSAIIMAIIGGALFPPLMGLIAVRAGTLAPALLLPAACFAIIWLYGRRVAAAI